MRRIQLSSCPDLPFWVWAREDLAARGIDADLLICISANPGLLVNPF